MATRKSTVKLGPDGRALDKLLAAERPKLYQQLQTAGKLNGELVDGEKHLHERAIRLSSSFENRNPKPNANDALLRWISRRENWVSAELAREMKNWVNNYPNLSAKSA